MKTPLSQRMLLVASWLLITTTTALAEPLSGVSASHSIDSVSTDVDGQQWVKLALTLNNDSGTDLENMALLLISQEEIAPLTEAQALSVGTLQDLNSITISWDLPTYSEDPALPWLLIGAEASDPLGTLYTFPLNSERQEVTP